MSFHVKFFTTDAHFRAAISDTKPPEGENVISVNGRRGNVVLNPDDTDIHGAAAKAAAADADELLCYDSAQHSNRKLSWQTIKTVLVSFLDGIYLREHQSLVGYAKEAWVEAKGYLTEHQSLTAYAKQSWVEAKGYLTEHQDISGKQDVITDLATIRSGAAKGATALQEHQSLAAYAKQSWVEAKGYLTQHQDISGKADKSVVDGIVSDMGGAKVITKAMTDKSSAGGCSVDFAFSNSGISSFVLYVSNYHAAGKGLYLGWTSSSGNVNLVPVLEPTVLTVTTGTRNIHVVNNDTVQAAASIFCFAGGAT